MKSFSMNKVLGTIKKRPTFGGAGASDEASIDPASDTPEAIAARCVKQFCHSVGSATGDDVVFLPSIVEAAVASPDAAAECARRIRKYMTRDYWTKPSIAYNAVMLLRILADNPGPGFTRYLDKKFVETAKELLRNGRDAGVRQILMESLDTFENAKGHDEGLAPLVDMWKKEKEKAYKAYGGVPGAPVPRMLVAPPFDPRRAPSHVPHRQSSMRLPDPVELANRLEEARTSAKLLEQVVACTPPSEVLSNELIKEFSERCSAASRSIQGYMAAENPAPDNDTMESLIDTNEQLQQALNHHHRAVLQAKKQLGGNNHRSSTSSPVSSHHQQHQSRPLPALPSRGSAGGAASGSGNNNNGKGKATLDAYHNSSSSVAGPSRSANATPHRADDTDDDDNQDPFRDPPNVSSASRAGGKDDSPPRLSFEPYHPGFAGSSSSARGEADRQGRAGTPETDDELDAYRAEVRRARQGVEEGQGSGSGHVYRY